MQRRLTQAPFQCSGGAWWVPRHSHNERGLEVARRGPMRATGKEVKDNRHVLRLTPTATTDRDFFLSFKDTGLIQV